MQVSDTQACVLRVLNGPLQGGEFLLSQPATLFVVGPAETFCQADAPASVPAEAIYIPLERGGCNFEVLLRANSRDGCLLRVLGEQGGQERALAFQVAEQVGALRIALRPEGEPWAEGVLDAPASHAPLPAGRRVAKPLAWLPVSGALLLAVALGIGAWALRSNPVADVEQLVAGAPTPLEVVRGPRGQVYVFAEQEREARWARQVLTRQGQGATPVLSLQDERSRLQALLADRYPNLAYHRIDLSDVRKPELWLSQQRNLLTPQFQQALHSLLRDAAPYAADVNLRQYDDTALVAAAERGLARLAVPYERDDKTESVTFRVQGNLADTELIAVRDYVNEFYRAWGDRYVHFAVELKDDWLKDKSFQYGPQGYIKLTPSSWYFPKPQ
ncbi:PrgH/EprH family type III secretion apparatus protein [Pseudomonas typographi]|uniref:PrgH/EprH family type III secretion apparatus protein n=1 Tax=Pseudomonas typographi TaxID=2715964 RepID=A0ABR7Z209_9PSED|nr:PrgH/EprH family type III secretion apparatus protein [Pseudomonas typographi]MBD1552400.1 PrgH/EprH family type III secretion apparatus protein [Pseudomonas typographi]MBD1587205.1 PrgH/EprH family type III secretion apparatus protein [Pseudomonas typographi]MBD1599518.1 PrgH/EprH family type III secretion apparatus protein [Pseudomonas typographi]